MRHFGDDMQPGDVFIMNDPFDGGMHLPDIFVFKPLYHEGERLAFACTVCHHTDVGGRVAGLERLRLDRDLRRGPAHRAAEALRGGQAQRDADDASSRRTCACRCRCSATCAPSSPPATSPSSSSPSWSRSYGAASRPTLYMHETIDYAERLTRAALAKLPDGEWSFEDWIDDDGVDYGKPIRLFVTIRKTRRPHGGRLDRHQPAGEGRDQQHALLHQGRLLHRRALGAAAGHPQQRGRVPRHRGDLPARHGRQRRAAGGLRGARPHRLPHGRLHVRRARA